MKTVAIMNQKGGTGKTTSAINLAGELAARRERVLLVDTDTQGNATSNLHLTEVPAATLTDVICGKGPSLADAVCRTSVEGLDLIRGGTLLAPALVAMQELRFGRDTVLRRLLPQIPDTYDYVFFDCSPSLESLFNINVLMAVQYILIPIKVDKNSIEGYDVMLETVREHLLANPAMSQEELCGLRFRLSVPSFFQINRAQTQRLYQLVTEFAGLTGEETVLDLYCGVGSITLLLAGKARRAIGGEIVPQAVENAKKNALANGAASAEFVQGDAG